MFIHPQPPHRHISAPCVFAFTPVSGVFFPPDVTVCVFVVWMQLSGWRVKSLTASLRLARTGRQRRSREGERRTETWNRPGLLSGRSVSVQASAGRRGEKMGGQLLSPLMSTHFFHQLSIYRPILHPVPSNHAHKARWLKPSLQVIPNKKSIHSQTFQPPDLGRVWNTDSKMIVQIWLFKLSFKIPSVVCVMKTWEEGSFQSRTLNKKYSQYIKLSHLNDCLWRELCSVILPQMRSKEFTWSAMYNNIKVVRDKFSVCINAGPLPSRSSDVYTPSTGLLPQCIDVHKSIGPI